MIHQEWTGKLDAYLDGELPDSDMRQLDAHLRGCSECAAESLRRLQWKRSIHSAGQRFVADPGFRERVVKNLGRKEKGRGWFAWWPAFGLAAVAIALLVGGIAVQQNARRARNDQIFSELADLHVSTLASATPVDIVSTDRHTVKPWFEGKIPFTFNLPELQGSSFELLGGRVSYLEQSPGAELIFRVRKHQISAFIFQDKALGSDFPGHQERDARSFHAETFVRNGLRYFVMGDAGPEDLRALAELLRNAR